MERSCARAVELGLPAIAFTEHVDHTPWLVRPGDLDGFEHLAVHVTDGVLVPPALDLDGYLAELDRCRDLFPDLRILAGLELGEPHWHTAEAARLLGTGRLERALGSLHCLPVEGGFVEADQLYRDLPAAQVLEAYLAELERLVTSAAPFTVLAHIDYPVRSWPAAAGRFDPAAFEPRYRHVLRLLADSGRALEVNTVLPLDPRIVGWWRDEGGTAVTFGSDAHQPERLARGFAEAAAMVQAHGFRPGRHPHDVWT